MFEKKTLRKDIKKDKWTERTYYKNYCDLVNDEPNTITICIKYFSEDFSLKIKVYTDPCKDIENFNYCFTDKTVCTFGGKFDPAICPKILPTEITSKKILADLDTALTLIRQVMKIIPQNVK